MNAPDFGPDLDPDFEWIGTTMRSTKAVTRATHEDEVSQRAFLFARLGYPKKLAESRLRSYLTWEYESIGKPAISKRIGALVTAAYKRAGISAKKK